jgi:hypothetical protein
MPIFEFDRYRNGRKMAEGVQISKANTEEEARLAARALYSSAEEMGELRRRCETCGGDRRVMANIADEDRFDVRAQKCTETVPCPVCTTK